LEVKFHRLAERELTDAELRYRGQSTRVADRFLVAVDNAIQRITADPLLCDSYLRGSRWFKLRKFPYVIYFKIKSQDRIVILAFAHQQRRPGYWIGRLYRP
jgi:toxin ParE1/3/4